MNEYNAINRAALLLFISLYQTRFQTGVGEDFAMRALTGRFAGCASTGSWMLYRITPEKIFRHQIQRIPTDLSRPVFGVFTRCTKKGALGIAKELRPAPRPPTTPPGGVGWDTTAGASLRPPPGARSWSPPPSGARGQFGAKNEDLNSSERARPRGNSFLKQPAGARSLVNRPWGG